MRATPAGPAKVDAPVLAVVDPVTLRPVASLTAAAATSPSIAEEVAAASGGRVVEAFEVPA
jgi:hypothetical protein